MSTNPSNVIDINQHPSRHDNSCLSEIVRESLLKYLQEMDGAPVDNLYDMVIQQVEQPLLAVIMSHVNGNQSKAAECLGINRGTLRKKLKAYSLLK